MMIKRVLFGFVLSAPLSIAYYIGFTKSLSNSENNLVLGVMFLVFVLTLPGSLVLFLIGFMAAFQGELGEKIAGVCMLLSIFNAHGMGVFYYWLFESAISKKKNAVVP